MTGAVDAPAFEGSGTVHDTKLNVPALAKPLEIRNAAIRVSKDSASFDDLSLALGSMNAKGNLALQNFDRPRVEFAAEVDRLDAAELQQIAAAGPEKKGTESSKPVRISGAGTVRIGTLAYDRIELQNVRAECKLENGLIRLDPVSAALYGGSQTGSIVIDTRPAHTAIAIRSKLQKADANQLLSAVTSIRQLLFGTLSGELDIQAAPQPGQEFASALNGAVEVQLADGRLAGVQLLNELAGVAKFLGYNASNATFTNILKLGGSLNISNGVASTNDLALEFDGGSLAASGTIGLADQQLNLRTTAVLNKDLSQRTGGSRVGGFMSTVLANANGELVIPALVTGTFGKPRFQPDPARIAKMKLEGLLPTRENPTGAASRIRGLLDTLKQPPAAEPKSAEPQQPARKKGVLDIIESLRKKKDEQK
jgi:AsmA protein